MPKVIFENEQEVKDFLEDINDEVLSEGYVEISINIIKETPILWHNPWAKRSLSESLWLLPQRKINKQTGLIEKKEGISTVKVFNLPDNWPFVDDRD